MIISIYNQKGGVGKTTTTVNLGAALAAKGKNVLIVDADPQGHSTLGVGIDKRELDKTLYDLMIIKKPTLSDIVEVLKETKYAGLFVLPANNSLSNAREELSSAFSRETILKKLLGLLKDNFHYILIDCNPGFDILSVNALTASDKLLIPITSEYFSIDGIVELTHHVDLIKETVNPQLETLGVLLTKYDVRQKSNKQAKVLLQDTFKDKFFNTVIRIDKTINDSQDAQTPIIYFNMKKKSHAYEDYMALAAELEG